MFHLKCSVAGGSVSWYPSVKLLKDKFNFPKSYFLKLQKSESEGNSLFFTLYKNYVLYISYVNHLDLFCHIYNISLKYLCLYLAQLLHCILPDFYTNLFLLDRHLPCTSPWTTRKMNKWVQEQIKPETLLEELYYFWHIRSIVFLGKDNNAETVEGSRQRVRPLEDELTP